MAGLQLHLGVKTLSLSDADCTLLLQASIAAMLLLAAIPCVVLCAIYYRKLRSKRNSGRCKTTPTLEIPDSTPAGHERYAMVDMPPAASPSLQDLYQQGETSPGAEGDPELPVTSFSNTIYFSTSRNTDFTNLTFRKTAEQDGAKVIKPKEEAIYAEPDVSQPGVSKLEPETAGVYAYIDPKSLESAGNRHPVCPSKGGQLIVPTLPQKPAAKPKTVDVDMTSPEGVKVDMTSPKDVKVDMTSSEGVKLNMTSSEYVKMDMTSSEDGNVYMVISDSAPEDVKIDMTSSEDVKIDMTSSEDVKIDMTSSEDVKIDMTSSEDV